MRKVLTGLLLILVVAVTRAQSNEATSAPSSASRPVKTAKAPRPATKTTKPVQEEGLFFRALTWARKSAYAASQGGRAYAEGLIRKTPKTFAAVRKEIDGLGKRVAGNAAFRDLDEKRRYVAELWRLRASLDLMALLDPNTLQLITGIDAKSLQGLSRTLTGVAKTLGVGATPPATKASSRG